MGIALIVPVYKNFEGFTRLVHSVDTEVLPIVIPNWEENIGVSRGWNEGLRRAIAMDCDFALVCNDDVVLEPKTIQKLLEAMVFNKYDLITPVSGPAEDYGYRPEPDFACFMVRPAQFVDQFGWFDENFSPAYFEDNDMTYRLTLQDAKMGCRTDTGMYHAGSVTQNWGGQQVVTSHMFEANRAYYVSKWGGVPGSEIFLEPFGGIQ